MNYQRIYDQLILKRQEYPSDATYTEKHHIIPKCFGGTNKKSNIVILTPREHFIAHRLLVKMNVGERKAKMFYALTAISFMKNESQEYRHQISSRLYDRIRSELAALQSINMLGEKNPFFGKTFSDDVLLLIAAGGENRRGTNNGMFGQTHTEESKLAMSIKRQGQLMGDSNPSKRPEVRLILRNGKLGDLNPKALKWKIITPTEKIIYIHGGIKRKILKYVKTFAIATLRNGWIIEKISEFPIDAVIE